MCSIRLSASCHRHGLQAKSTTDRRIEKNVVHSSAWRQPPACWYSYSYTYTANSTLVLVLDPSASASASAHGSRRQQAPATMPIHDRTSIPQDPIRSLVDTSVEDDDNDDDEILDDDMTDEDERQYVSSNANNNLMPISDDVCKAIGSASANTNNAGHHWNSTMLNDDINMTGQEQQQQLHPRRKGSQRLNTSSCAPSRNMPPCSSNNNLPPTLPNPTKTQPCTSSSSNHYFATTATQGSSNANAVHITPLHYIPYVHGGYAAAAPLFVSHSKFAYILKKLLPGAYEELSVLLRICEVTFGTSGGGGGGAPAAAGGESTALCLDGRSGNNSNNTKYKGMNPTHTQASSSSSSSSPNVVTSSSNSLLALDTKAGRKDIMVVSTAGAVLPVTMPEVTLADPVKSKSNN
jgi:hypothetical protein